MSPPFGFLKGKTSNYFQNKKKDDDDIQSVTIEELFEIIEKEKKGLEKDLSNNLEPIRNSVLNCLDRLRKSADDLEGQETKVENPKFKSVINNSKKVLIASIKKESFLESSEIKTYEDAIRFKNKLEILVKRFGQVGTSHNRIFNEFIRKQISKLKNEFENLSSLQKELMKILPIKDDEIKKCVLCKDDLILYEEKYKERNDRRLKLSDSMNELQSIDNSLVISNNEFEEFKKSEKFLNTSNILEKINDKKNEIEIFEKNMINMVSSISRAITKFSYITSKDIQLKLATIINHPLEILNETNPYIQLLRELRKQIVENKVQIKDPEKTIRQIDQIIKSLPSLSMNLKNLNEEMFQLKSSVESKNMNYLDDIKRKIKRYEEQRLENINNMDETKNMIDDLDSELKTLKERIEDNIHGIMNKRYNILQPSN